MGGLAGYLCLPQSKSPPPPSYVPLPKFCKVEPNQEIEVACPGVYSPLWIPQSWNCTCWFFRILLWKNYAQGSVPSSREKELCRQGPRRERRGKRKRTVFFQSPCLPAILAFYSVRALFIFLDSLEYSPISLQERAGLTGRLGCMCWLWHSEQLSLGFSFLGPGLRYCFLTICPVGPAKSTSGR